MTVHILARTLYNVHDYVYMYSYCCSLCCVGFFMHGPTIVHVHVMKCMQLVKAVCTAPFFFKAQFSKLQSNPALLLLSSFPFFPHIFATLCQKSCIVAQKLFMQFLINSWRDSRHSKISSASLYFRDSFRIFASTVFLTLPHLHLRSVIKQSHGSIPASLLSNCQLFHLHFSPHFLRKIKQVYSKIVETCQKCTCSWFSVLNSVSLQSYAHQVAITFWEASSIVILHDVCIRTSF